MQPQSPDPKFDFMLKDSPQAGRRLGLPAMGKPAKIIIFAVLALLVLVIISYLAGHRGGGTKTVVTVVAREQEILRVTQLVQQQSLQDPSTTALAATVSTTVGSQQAQLLKYLADNHAKPGKLQLAADLNKTADSQMQDAAQNNQLDSAYKNYLRQAIAKYQVELQTAYKSVGPNGKALLKDAYDSNNVLLASAPLKS